jgi:hypothetical protein
VYGSDWRGSELLGLARTSTPRRFLRNPPRHTFPFRVERVGSAAMSKGGRAHGEEQKSDRIGARVRESVVVDFVVLCTVKGVAQGWGGWVGMRGRGGEGDCGP